MPSDRSVLPPSLPPRGPRPLGKKQRDLLAKLSSVWMGLVVGDAVSESLVRRGLLAAESDGSWAHITAAGLRALADEVDAGRVRLFSPEKLRAQAAERG